MHAFQLGVIESEVLKAMASLDRSELLNMRASFDFVERPDDSCVKNLNLFPSSLSGTMTGSTCVTEWARIVFPPL